MRTDSLSQFTNLRRQLTQERDQLSRPLATLNEALGQLSGIDSTTAYDGGRVGGGSAAPKSPGKRTMSAAARARIAAAQRKRWAATRGKTGASQTAAPKNGSSSGKRQISPAARKKIAEAARKRWAAAKRAGKNRL